MLHEVLAGYQHEYAAERVNVSHGMDAVYHIAGKFGESTLFKHLTKKSLAT